MSERGLRDGRSDMNADLRVGVLLTAYNERMHILECLQGLLSQTQPPEHVVLVDDGSTDGTHEELVDFARTAPFRVSVVQSGHVGRSAALNRGLAVMEADAVMIQDADDVSLPERIALHARYLASGGTSWHGGQMTYIGTEGEPLGIVTKFPVSRDDVVAKLQSLRMPIAHGASAYLLTPRARSGWYLEEASGAEDLDLALRVGREMSIISSSEVVLLCRSEEHDLSWGKWRAYRSRHHYVVTELRRESPLSFDQWWSGLDRVRRIRAVAPHVWVRGRFGRVLAKVSLPRRQRVLT